MTEQVPTDASEAAETEQESATTTAEPSTGVPAVDGVLTGLGDLGDLPLEEHLAVFERAHGSLRAALDAEPDDPA
jgi:hypothetical protein